MYENEIVSIHKMLETLYFVGSIGTKVVFIFLIINMINI